MSRFKYPVDTDQFMLIREQGLVYVDKTDLLFDLVSRYRYAVSYTHLTLPTNNRV